jgi:hypothetical protein
MHRPHEQGRFWPRAVGHAKHDYRRFLKHSRLWLLAFVLAGMALALLLFIRTWETLSEARMRKVRIGMTQSEVTAVLGPPTGDSGVTLDEIVGALGFPTGDGFRALLWRDDTFLRKRKDRLWVRFDRGIVDEVHIQPGEPDKRSLPQRLRDWWRGSQQPYELYL